MKKEEGDIPTRRVRPVAPALGTDDDPSGFSPVFRARLTYLMNGNSALQRPINIQELADEIGISRPAVRKYLRPSDRRELTVPSALVVCRIARFFRTSPNFLLGFDEEVPEEEKMSAESDSYNALGLSQTAVDRLKALRGRAAQDPQAAALLRLLDRMICSYADEAEKLYQP